MVDQILVIQLQRIMWVITQGNKCTEIIELNAQIFGIVNLNFDVLLMLQQNEAI